MQHISITGWGGVLGSKRFQSKGMTRYRINNDQDHYSLALDAIAQALEHAGTELEEMDLILYAGAVGFQPIPCSAALISQRLNSARPIPCMDINTSCSSFVSALDMASCMMEQGRYEKVLIVTVDIASAGLNPAQKESFELFSDAATAYVISKTKNKHKGVEFALQKTWSDGANLTEVRGGLLNLPAREYSAENREDYLFDMKGRQALFFTQRRLGLFLKELLSKSGIPLEEIDLIIPHQASRALPMIMKHYKIPEEQYMDRVREYGNMIASSIPFMLALALEEKRIRHGNRILLLGTAAGLTISGLILKI